MKVKTASLHSANVIKADVTIICMNNDIPIIVCEDVDGAILVHTPEDERFSEILSKYNISTEKITYRNG